MTQVIMQRNMDERRLKELLHIINIRRHDDEYSLVGSHKEERVSSLGYVCTYILHEHTAVE